METYTLTFANGETVKKVRPVQFAHFMLLNGAITQMTETPAPIVTKTVVDVIDLADIARTYRGKTGCACGCNGDYFDVDDAEHSKDNSLRINYIRTGIKKGSAEFFGNGVEVANPSYTSVTRLYFVDDISYTLNGANELVRIETKDAE